MIIMSTAVTKTPYPPGGLKNDLRKSKSLHLVTEPHEIHSNDIHPQSAVIIYSKMATKQQTEQSHDTYDTKIAGEGAC